jgi:hypothetical protein
MKAYRTTLTVEDSKQVVLRDLPFDSGQRVEILVVPEKANGRDAAKELRSLLKDTQALPQVRALSDDDIAAEVAAYRAGQ